MPWRFIPRVGPFVYTPSRRPPSSIGRTLYALFWLVVVALMIVAHAKGA